MTYTESKPHDNTSIDRKRVVMHLELEKERIEKLKQYVKNTPMKKTVYTSYQLYYVPVLMVMFSHVDRYDIDKRHEAHRHSPHAWR